MSETLGGRNSATCGHCLRAVQIVQVDGQAVAVDPEVMAFVPTDRAGRTTRSPAIAHGRRVHAGLCSTYQLEAERKAQKARDRAELRAYERKPRGKTKAL
jgi:hypothetical protein